MPPRISQVSVSAQVPRIAWESVAGATYAVQFKTTISHPAWSNLPPDVTATGTITKIQDASATNATQRFYRIQVRD
jgi:hypothetical protein